MSMQCEAVSRSGVEDVHCIMPSGHAGEHKAYADDGRTIHVWAPVAEPAVTPITVTLDEFLEHQNDLADQAAAEGFHHYAAVLEHLRLKILVHRAEFERGRRPPAAPSPLRVV